MPSPGRSSEHRSTQTRSPIPTGVTLQGSQHTHRYSSGQKFGQLKCLKKKKGVTRVAHAATLQLNPAKYGHNQNGKGVVRSKLHP
jgi:hypothetical protein